MSAIKRILHRFRARTEASVIKSEQTVFSGFEPSNPEFITNPYPYLAALREQSPVFRSDFGPWVFTRFDDINAALSDNRLSNVPAPYAIVNQKNRERYVCADVASHLIAFMDPPEQVSVRRLLARVFHQYLRSGLLDLNSIAKQMTGRLPASGHFDLLDSFASPYALEVVMQIYGFPRRDAHRLKYWTDQFFYLFTQIPSTETRIALDQALTEFREYTLDALQSRRVSPRADFLSMLVEAADSEKETFSDQSLVDNAMLIFADGIENVDSGIANAVACLLKSPLAWKSLQNGEADISLAVNECLRFESPAQFIGRVALEDFELNNQIIRKGQVVLLVLASANRDSNRFENPDLFNMHRELNPYLSFGRGKHSCLGASLVQMEMEAALRALLKYAPNLGLRESKLDWQFRMGHRWLRSLQVELG